MTQSQPEKPDTDHLSSTVGEAVQAALSNSPAPWRVSGSETTLGIWVEDATGKRVATVRNHDRDADVARLIAAAPCLLRALQRIVENPEARLGGDIRAEAVAAIAKATGAL